MAQYPLLSVVSKIDHIQKDLLEIEQTLAMLLKVIVNMKSKQLGRRADVAKTRFSMLMLCYKAVIMLMTCYLRFATS